MNNLKILLDEYKIKNKNSKNENIKNSIEFYEKIIYNFKNKYTVASYNKEAKSVILGSKHFNFILSMNKKYNNIPFYVSFFTVSNIIQYIEEPTKKQFFHNLNRHYENTFKHNKLICQQSINKNKYIYKSFFDLDNRNFFISIKLKYIYKIPNLTDKKIICPSIFPFIDLQDEKIKIFHPKINIQPVYIYLISEIIKKPKKQHIPDIYNLSQLFNYDFINNNVYNFEDNKIDYINFYKIYNKFVCGCGSILKNDKKLYNHNKTIKHQQFLNKCFIINDPIIEDIKIDPYIQHIEDIKIDPYNEDIKTDPYIEHIEDIKTNPYNEDIKTDLYIESDESESDSDIEIINDDNNYNFLNKMYILFNRKLFFEKKERSYIIGLLYRLNTDNIKFYELIKDYTHINILKNIHYDNEEQKKGLHFNIKLYNKYNNYLSDTYHFYIENDKIFKITIILNIL